MLTQRQRQRQRQNFMYYQMADIRYYTQFNSLVGQRVRDYDIERAHAAYNRTHFVHLNTNEASSTRKKNSIVEIIGT